MKTLADIGEDELVRRLVRGRCHGSGVIEGPGDDCAVVAAPGAGRHLLLKTDTVVEGVHFTADTPAHLIGRKALARVLSDFAAMAATPRHALVTLIAPPTTPVRRVLDLYRGLHALARRFEVAVVGGETARGDQLIVTVSLSGDAPAKGWVRRHGAHAGDQLFVTGRLGGSLGGRHLSFQPRLAEAQWLVNHLPVRAMMDLSDGLAKDLPRLAGGAGLGFEVDPEVLPCATGCSPAQAWGDGEDYELLLAVDPGLDPAALAAWRKTFPRLPLTCIGRLTDSPRRRVVPAGGWDHFLS
jgi:thiamine-monophosphate kinase